MEDQADTDIFRLKTNLVLQKSFENYRKVSEIFWKDY